MTKANVEIVRAYFEASARANEKYWEQPFSLAAALRSGQVPPEGEEMLSFLHPELEWKPLFSTQTYRGHLGGAQAWDEFLEAAESYSIALADTIEAGDDRVIAVVDGTLKGKGSGIELSARMCTVMTISDGLIRLAQDYLDLDSALEAVGLAGKNARGG
jgi:ketosteroid isomerase-like protein